MKWFILFLATFACVSNVALTSNIMTSNEEELTKLDVTKVTKQNDCLAEFLPTKLPLLVEFQKQTLACLESTNDRKHNKLVLLKNLRSEAANKMKNIQESLESCNLKNDQSDYFECLKSLDYESRNVLDEIKDHSERLVSKFNEMEKQKRDCLNKNVEENSVKIQNTLMSCMSKDNKSSISPQVEKLKKIYETLKICAQDDSEDDYFEDCMKPATTDKDLQYYWANSAAQFSEELTEIDHKENICLRHFVTSYVFPSYNFNYNLEKCLREGLNETVNSDERSEIVTQYYAKVRSLLSSCKVNSNQSEIEMCVFEVVKTSQDSQGILFYTSSMSDSYLRQLYEQILTQYNNEETCLGYLFENVQFKGLFMKDSSKASMKECLDKAYVSNTTPPTANDVLTRLSTIKDFLAKCLLKPKPAVHKCVAQRIGAHSNSLDYIISSPLYETQYKEPIEQHDKEKGTCYVSMVNDNKVKSYASVEKCIKRKFYNRN